MIFNIDKTLADGRVMTSHLIHDRQVDMQTFNIRVIIRSYPDDNAVYGNEYVEFYVDVPHTDYQMSYVEDLEAQVLALQWKQLNIDEVKIKTLSELKDLKRAEIDTLRSEARFANAAATVSGISYQWQADATSQELLSTAINFAVLGINTAPPIWRTADNIDVTVSLDDLKTIAGAMAQQTSYAYYKSFQLKAAVSAATTKAQVKAIAW